jgi:hypothetical protein
MAQEHRSTSFPESRSWTGLISRTNPIHSDPAAIGWLRTGHLRHMQLKPNCSSMLKPHASTWLHAVPLDDSTSLCKSDSLAYEFKATVYCCEDTWFATSAFENYAISHAAKAPPSSYVGCMLELGEIRASASATPTWNESTQQAERPKVSICDNCSLAVCPSPTSIDAYSANLLDIVT